ncbi:hypothetical protein G176_gp09 [Xanthomonas phage CP1]|uniref:AP2/ERF domain-containing protein n=1 Tax=Xanthomonas phage CP1 TaxID=2994055 RepID=I7H416_9CAUD|nr:hypothetical protein G176_gp09 [Xanthomonas phage CP1]BAM29081.1 hypothetical protein [Xanthomonas phage CP1]
MSLREALMNQLSYDRDTGLFTRKVETSPRTKKGEVAGHLNRRGYVQIKALGKSHQAHRLAWLFVKGVWPTRHIDHIDGNPGNNSFRNLRECNDSENSQNRTLAVNSISGLRGANFHQSSGMWQAEISVGGVRHYLGKHTTPELAHVAYLAAKAKLHTFQPVPRGE